MTFEERCIVHYSKVEERVGKYPPKRPIIMPPPVPLKKRPFPSETNGRSYPTLYEYDEAGIKAMRRNGITMAAIGEHFNIPNKTMQSYIRKHRARWEAEDSAECQ